MHPQELLCHKAILNLNVLKRRIRIFCSPPGTYEGPKSCGEMVMQATKVSE